MTFTSIKFLLFLAIFLIVYAATPARFRQYTLLLGSLVFAVFGSWLSALICVLFAVFSFIFGGLISGQRDKNKRRLYLLIGVAGNAIALICFKAFSYLPLGVSYYTFSCIAYIVDVYRRTIPAENNPAAFAAFVTMFPKLQQGPITRYEEVSQNLMAPRVSWRGIQAGLESFVLGFCLKVLLADKLGGLWGELEMHGFQNLSMPLAWLGIITFSMQLYLEWQSYTFMALGIGKMLGFNLPNNFNYPYLAKTIGEFYRRWHMTLMRWFKDYIYIPLGGSRKGMVRTVLNILIVWFITSVWHGLGWNFLLWGMGLGVLIVLEKLFLGKLMDKLKILPHLYVIFFIVLSWCCFKVTDIHNLGVYFGRLFPMFGGSASRYQVGIGQYSGIWPYLLAGVLFCFPIPENIVRRFGKTWPGAIILSVLFWWAVYTVQKSGSMPLAYASF